VEACSSKIFPFAQNASQPSHTIDNANATPLTLAFDATDYLFPPRLDDKRRLEFRLPSLAGTTQRRLPHDEKKHFFHRRLRNTPAKDVLNKT
jgi:hypothetical protein